MQGNVRIALLIVVVAATVAGLFLVGFFDDEGGLEPSANPASRITGDDRGDGDRNAPESTPSAARTNRFTGQGEAATAKVAGTGSGIRLSGEVRGSEGKSLSGARVRLIRDVGQMVGRFQEGRTVAETVTRRAGRFQFDDLAPGDVYVLKVSHPTHTTKRVHPIDSRIPSTLRQVVTLDGGIPIAGVVKDDGGRLIEGAVIEVFEVGVASVNPTPEPERAGESAADGTFRIDNLNAGVKKILVSKDGYATDGMSALDLRDGRQGEKLEFVLGRGFTIAGIVLDRDSGQPVVGASISARPVAFVGTRVRNVQAARSELKDDGEGTIGTSESSLSVRAPSRHGSINAKSFLTAHAMTDETGRFRLSGLLEAHYTIQTSAPGYNRNHGIRAAVGREDIEIRLVASPRIRGRVVDAETGQPVPAFTVAVSASPDPMFMPANAQQRFSAPDGRFEYLDARPGKAHLSARAPGYAGARTIDPVMLRPGENVEDVVLELVRGARIEGQVLDKQGAPVVGASVALIRGAANNLPPNPFTDALRKQMRSRSSSRTMTGKDGRFVVPNMLGGHYRIQLKCSGFAEFESPDSKEVPDSGTYDVGVMRMLRGATIEGVVRLDSGDPDSKATVMLSLIDEGAAPFGKSVKTGQDGRYLAEGLRPGTYRVIAVQRNGQFRLDHVIDPARAGAKTVTVSDGERVSIDL